MLLVEDGTWLGSRQLDMGDSGSEGVHPEPMEGGKTWNHRKNA